MLKRIRYYKSNKITEKQNNKILINSGINSMLIEKREVIAQQRYIYKDTINVKYNHNQLDNKWLYAILNKEQETYNRVSPALHQPKNCFTNGKKQVV